MAGSVSKGACLARIRARLQDGSKATLKVAKFILKSPAQAQGMSIASLASACGASTASVSRFCKDLGYLSFKDFQLDLSAAMARDSEQPLDLYSAGGTPKSIIRRVFEANRHSLTDTEQTLEPVHLLQATRWLGRASRIFLLGSGGSSLVAAEAQHRFLSLGITAIAIGDAYTMIKAMSTVDRRDAVVGISQSGRNEFVLKALREARQRRAHTIALTNFPRSPIAVGAEVTLITAYREHRVKRAVSSSHIAQLCVVDALYFLLGNSISRRGKKPSGADVD